MNHETNLFDLIIACGRGIKRLAQAFGRLLADMCRLTVHYWWCVLPIWALVLAAALYYSRPTNQKFKVNAVARLTGPTLAMTKEVWEPLRQGLPFTGDYERLLGVDSETAHQLSRFETYDVIDCLGDSTADFIDFKQKTKRLDTLNIHMQDRICLQFRMRGDLSKLPQVEEKIMNYLNTNPNMIRAYNQALPTLEREVRFCHDQIEKLDSMTSSFYFLTQDHNFSFSRWNSGFIIGDREIDLPLQGIYTHIKVTQFVDDRYAFATAPVVLENHFVVTPRATNSLPFCGLIGLIFGWICGCIPAALLRNRKKISAWLKQ